MTDDTQELGKIFASGKGAADVESDLVYDQVTGGSYGGAPLYSTGRNTLTGSTPFRSNVNQRAPQYNYDGVIAMQVAFRKRLGPKGSKLNLSLGFVLVPLSFISSLSKPFRVHLHRFLLRLSTLWLVLSRSLQTLV